MNAGHISYRSAVVAAVSAALWASSGCLATPATSGTLHENFVRVLQAQPADYAAAQDEFMQDRDAAVSLLRAKALNSVSWYERSLATAVLLRHAFPVTSRESEEAFSKLSAAGRPFRHEYLNPGGDPPKNPLPEAGPDAGAFLIEKLFKDVPRRVPDSTRKGYHTSDPQYTATRLLQSIGGKDAARAVAVATLFRGQAAGSIHRASFLTDSQLTDMLLPLLRDITLQSVAGWALGELGDPRAVQPLMDSLIEDSTPGCYPCADALAKIGSPSVLPLLHVASGPKTGIMRFSWARHSLTKLGDNVRQTLYTALISDLPISRREAIISISALYGKDAVLEALEDVWPGSASDDRAIELVVSGFTNYLVQMTEPLRDALVEIGQPAVPRLQEALNSPLPETRSWAKSSLEKIREKALGRAYAQSFRG